MTSDANGRQGGGPFHVHGCKRLGGLCSPRWYVRSTLLLNGVSRQMAGAGHAKKETLCQRWNRWNPLASKLRVQRYSRRCDVSYRD